MDIIATLSREFAVRPEQIKNTVELLDDGKTVPFIARYRKELTGSLDDQVLRAISDRLEYLRNLEKRKEEVLASIQAQEKLTPELEESIGKAATLVEVEDLYRPYKQKKKTRASVARERGLEPLSQLLLAQDPATDPVIEAQAYVSEQVPDAQAALQGVRRSCCYASILANLTKSVNCFFANCPKKGQTLWNLHKVCPCLFVGFIQVRVFPAPKQPRSRAPGSADPGAGYR